MLDIGFQELIVVMVIALLVFGPYKLPELGRALGRAMREFRRASDEFRSTIETNLHLTEDPLGSLTSTEPTATAGEPSPTPGEPTPATPSPDAMTAAAEPVAAGLAGEGGAASGEGAVPAGSAVRPELVEPFCGSRTGRLLHRSTCAWVQRISEWDRVAFKTVDEAVEIGRTRCPACNP